jgi:hypothetical protein
VGVRVSVGVLDGNGVSVEVGTNVSVGGTGVSVNSDTIFVGSWVGVVGPQLDKNRASAKTVMMIFFISFSFSLPQVRIIPHNDVL